MRVGDSKLLVDREIIHQRLTEMHYVGLPINDKKMPKFLNLIVYALDTRYEGLPIVSEPNDGSIPFFVRRSLVRNSHGDFESEEP